MIQLVLLIVILLFFNDEIFNTNKIHNDVSCTNSDAFMSGVVIPPFNEDEYNLWNPDFEFYFDKTGRKGILYNNLDIDINTNDEYPKKQHEKFDNVNSILNKLEIYPPEIYNSC